MANPFLKLLRSAHRRLRSPVEQKMRTRITNKFHALYYNSAGQTWQNTRWLDVCVAKTPFDLWVYQEIILEIKPDLIIECGTWMGGSALFLASICDLLDHGQVVTIDIDGLPDRPKHDRIRYICGSSTSEDTLQEVRRLVLPQMKVMVILDSDHRKSHVGQELRAYGPFVTKGSYLIVEDTNINGHPVLPTFGEGPMEAVEEFLRDNTGFLVDRTREKFFMTFNPKGFLRRVGP